MHSYYFEVAQKKDIPKVMQILQSLLGDKIPFEAKPIKNNVNTMSKENKRGIAKHKQIYAYENYICLTTNKRLTRQDELAILDVRICSSSQSYKAVKRMMSNRQSKYSRVNKEIAP